MNQLNINYVEKLFFEIASALDDDRLDIEPENLSALKQHVETSLIANRIDVRVPSAYDDAGKATHYFIGCILKDDAVSIEVKQDFLAIQRAFLAMKVAA